MKNKDNLLECERKPKTYLQKVRNMYSEKSVGWMFYNFLNKINRKNENKNIK